MSNPDNFKQAAKRLKAILKERYDVDIQHGTAIEIVSQAEGYRDWNTACADLKSKEADGNRTGGDE